MEAVLERPRAAFLCDEPPRKVLAGVELGGTEVRCLVAAVSDGVYRYVGAGAADSSGMKKGEVVDLEAASAALREAVREAERTSSLQLDSASVAVNGAHLLGMRGSGAIPLCGGSEAEVTYAEVARALRQASAVALPSERAMVQAEIQEFDVDDCSGVVNPVGMRGYFLVCRAHIVTCSSRALANLRAAARRAGLHAEIFCASPIAAANEALTDDEKALGAILVDVGFETTQVTVYSFGAPRMTFVVPAGGAHITSDIARAFRLGLSEAERIKLAAGLCKSSLLAEEECEEVISAGGMEMTREELCVVVEARVEELLQLVRRKVSSACERFRVSGGVVLTGGGALVRGMVEKARDVFASPARLAETPAMSASLSGLLKWAAAKLAWENSTRGVGGWLLRGWRWLRTSF